jgi:hypothetical protein
MSNVTVAGATITVNRTNLSPNPRAEGPGGFYPNNFNTHTRDQRTTGFAAHPLGLTTAYRSHVLAGQTGQAATQALSMYDLDSLGNTGPARGVGVWVYSVAAGYQVAAAGGFPVTPLPAGQWTFVTTTSLVPANTYSALFVEKANGTNAAVADNVFVTGVIALAGKLVTSYFDGSTPAGAYEYGWTGATGQSTSTEATVVYDPTTAPSVRVSYAASDLHPLVHHVTAYRIVENVATSVRTAIDLFAVGGVVFDDAETPIGATATYRLQQYDSAGVELGYATTPSVVTIPSPNPVYAWISDPLNPASAVRVVLAETAARNRTRPIPGTLHKVGMRTVALVGQRGLLEQLPMDFFTETLVDRDRVDALITETSGLVLIRTAPPVPIPRLLYCWAANASPIELDPFGNEEATAWANTVEEVSPTEGAVLSIPNNWQIYIDAFPLWSDFNAAYLTWIDAMQNPPEV